MLYNTMKVVKRNGSSENISFDKILARIDNLCNIQNYKLSKYVDPTIVCLNTIKAIKDGISTTELDIESAKNASNMVLDHHDYSLLGARILISNLYKNLEAKYGITKFSEMVEYINNMLPEYLDKNYYKFVSENKDELDNIIIREYDYNIDYFGYKTLEYGYLIKKRNANIDEILETPQALLLRVSIALHMPDLNMIKINYNYMAQGKFIHATPTLFNAGTKIQQLSSCYLLGTDDSIEGIFKTIGDCAKISKWAGGIGIHVSNIRSRGQVIKSTNGKSDGIIPMLRMYNEVGKYINQSGKRNGAIAIYLEPWHADILDFLELRKNGGDETAKARDLFTALWIPDYFMELAKSDDWWYLMSEDECPGLSDVYGNEFKLLYIKYVEQGKYINKIKAAELLNRVIDSQAESGTPYIMFKDNINRKSNHKNIGIIKSSNLCAEIVEYSDANTYAVCNLASIAVNKFYNKKDNKYDYEGLYELAKHITNNLNKIIDINYYPTIETKTSNFNTRPIGIGIQGFADLLIEMNLPYESEDAIMMSAYIMETIYYGCIEQSNELAKLYGPYDKYIDSPFYNGNLQFDLWNMENDISRSHIVTTNKWDWNKLKQNIQKYGMRNSMLSALMPTASTSQILGNYECFEPITSNIYSRKVLSGTYIVVNKYLQQTLIELGLWTDNIRTSIIQNRGSIQNINEIPNHIKEIHKTVWEIKQKAIIDHALKRGPYVDQSQSMNLYFATSDKLKIRSALFYGWSNGIKTGTYYLRTRPAIEAQQQITTKNTKQNNTEYQCTMCSA